MIFEFSESLSTEFLAPLVHGLTNCAQKEEIQGHCYAPQEWPTKQRTLQAQSVPQEHCKLCVTSGPSGHTECN